MALASCFNMYGRLYWYLVMYDWENGVSALSKKKRGPFGVNLDDKFISEQPCNHQCLSCLFSLIIIVP
jgi:hypothetical protein